MQDRALLPPESGLVIARPRVGALLLSGLIACAGAVGLWVPLHPPAARPTCPHYHDPNVSAQLPPSDLSDSARAQLRNARAQLVSRDGAVAIHRGKIARFTYRLALLRIDEQLNPCERGRMLQRQEIDQLEGSLAEAVDKRNHHLEDNDDDRL